MTLVKPASRSAASAGADLHVLVLVGRLLDEVRLTLAADDWSGLRPSHFRMLSAVPAEGVRITDLALALGMTKQACGQFVTGLVESRHLKTLSDPSDRRVRVVVKTALGDRTVTSFNARIRRIERAWARRVGAERYAEFRSVLGALTLSDDDAARQRATVTQT